MTKASDYHPADAAKLAAAEAQFDRLKKAVAELEQTIVTARMVVRPSVRNRYAYHRKVDKHDPLTAAFFAGLGRLIWRV